MHYTVDWGAEKPNRWKGGNPEISNSRRPGPLLGLERQGDEPVFSESRDHSGPQKKLEPQWAYLMGAGATEERQPLLKVPLQAGEWRRVIKILASSFLLLFNPLRASPFGWAHPEASYHRSLRSIVCRGWQGRWKARKGPEGKQVQNWHTHFPFYKVRTIVPTSLCWDNLIREYM